MTKQTELDAKCLIQHQYGFRQSWITLLELSGKDYNTFDYIMFSVRGIEYQAKATYEIEQGRAIKKWQLSVYDGHGKFVK